MKDKDTQEEMPWADQEWLEREYKPPYKEGIDWETVRLGAFLFLLGTVYILVISVLAGLIIEKLTK